MAPIRDSFLRGACLILTAAAALTAGGAVAATPSSGQRAIDRLAALGRAFRTHTVWTAGYRQEYLPAGMSEGETAAGSVWLAWPDRAVFITGDPPQRTMALEGRSVRLIDFELGTCEEHVLDDREWERIPLVAVLDPGHALDHFRVKLLGERGLSLEPLDRGGIARVEVVIGEPGLPAEVTVVDIQGAVNRLWFTGWAPAPGPPGGRWMPDPPEGVSCQTVEGEADGR